MRLTPQRFAVQTAFMPGLFGNEQPIIGRFARALDAAFTEPGPVHPAFRDVLHRVYGRPQSELPPRVLETLKGMFNERVNAVLRPPAVAPQKKRRGAAKAVRS